MSVFDFLTGGSGQNPYEAAKNAYAPYGGVIKPYITGGKTAYNTSMDKFNQGVNNPTGLEDMIMQHWHTSPMARDMMDNAMAASHAAAARGGYLGTPEEQEAIGKQVGQIVDSDEQNYYNNAMHNYDTGLSGLSRYAMLAPQLAGDYYGNLAGLSEKGAAYDNANRGGGLLSALAGGLGGAATGSTFGKKGEWLGGIIGALGGLA